MTFHKIEININEIVNIDEPKEEIKISSYDKEMSSVDNRIVSNTIHETKATECNECQIIW